MRDFRHTPWAMAAMVERAKMALRQGQMEQAESLLRAVIWQSDSIAPDWALWARYWLAELEFYRGRLDSAQAHYSVLALRPESPVANDALQRLQVFEQARTVSEELLKRFGRAEFFAFQREYARAQVEFLAVAEGAGDHPLAEFALIRAAESAIAHGKLEEAQQIVNRYLANYDDVLYGDRALLLLGQIAEQQQRFPEALQLYQQLLLRYPGSIYTRQVQERIQSLRQRPS
jgi:TolA-binding protein